MNEKPKGMAEEQTVEIHPVQVHTHPHHRPQVSSIVTSRAYEVYCEIYSAQPAMMDLKGHGCRGGFSAGELIAFLYAHTFPKSEWCARADEAFRGMNYF